MYVRHFQRFTYLHAFYVHIYMFFVLSCQIFLTFFESTVSFYHVCRIELIFSTVK